MMKEVVGHYGGERRLITIETILVDKIRLKVETPFGYTKIDLSNRSTKKLRDWLTRELERVK